MRTLDRRGVEFSVGVKQSKQVRALIAAIPGEHWVTIEDYPETGEARVAQTALAGWRPIVRRTRLIGDRAEPWPDWRDHTFAANRTVPTLVAEIDDRDHASVELTIRGVKDQALRHSRSGRDHANSARAVIAALAHNLARWTRLIGSCRPRPFRPPRSADVARCRSPAG